MKSEKEGLVIEAINLFYRGLNSQVIK